MHNIGKIEGPILAFGGVYSNLQALEALRNIAVKLRIPASNIICTGDIVAYCAQPEECIQAVKDWGIHSISGNVEIQLATGQNDCACDFTSGSRCDSFSKEWYPFAQANVSPAAIDWMNKLPEHICFEYTGKQIAVVHGSYHYVSEFIFESTDWDIKEKNFIDTKSEIIIAGHCGLPFSQQKNNQYWLNPGVIGMPANDGTPRVWYMILNDDTGTLSYEHHSLEYDFHKANQLMMERNLPVAYAKTLVSGIWDNCEILPEQETALQGVSLFS